MILVEIAPLPNGAHRNQTTDFLIDPPEGWAMVPAELEAEAALYLPFIDVTLNADNRIIAVSKGEIPEQEPAPMPESNTDDDLMAISIDHEYRLTLLELGVI